MPSFLSRLLRRKNAQELELSADNPGNPTPLLEGKFEAISPNVSPSAAFFTDPGAAQIRGSDRSKYKESPFHLFRPRLRASADLPTVEKAAPDVPHLSLNLPIAKGRRRALDVVFDSDPEVFALISEVAIGERRLTPHEALLLVHACSEVIVERGLETLGVMHPHWYSASPEVQHKLISLYLLSLTLTSPNDATSPTSPTASATFSSELHYTHSPHDVAAVLRWGLRHLKLDGDSFGKEPGDWTWYNTFAEAERAGSYPLDAFSKFLIPQLPTSHTGLLFATLDIISSLSACCEANGSSGSKLSKFFGLWLLTSGYSTEGDGWSAFYDRWDRAGRILEHLFLARIRNDASRLPRRLTGLVEHYPYDYGVATPNDNLLPRPRFSTRQYDALFVQLDTEYASAVKPKSHPLRLIADALRAQSTSESATADDDGLWDTIKKASFTFDSSEGSSEAAVAEPTPIFSNIFSDDTIRLLSLIPVDVSDKDNPAPSFALQSPISPGRPRSFSLTETSLSPGPAIRGGPPPSTHTLVSPGLTANNSTAPATASPETPTDWLQFSNQGFGTTSGTRDLVATLWDNDVEVTVPPAPLSRKSSRRAHSRHSSLDSARSPVQPLPAVPPPPTSKTTLIAKVKLDEAFIDFWADSLLDPISKRWPRFVLCQLKPLPPTVTSAIPTPAWLIIEQRFVHLASVSPIMEDTEVTVSQARPRASSPRPESSRLSAAFSVVSKKRFALFTGGSSDPKSPKETTRLPQVGESAEATKGSEDGTVPAEISKEDGAKDVADGGAAPGVTTVGAAAAPQEEATQTLRKDGIPTRSAETVPSELADISATKADGCHNEEQREPEPEMAAAPGPGGAGAALSPPVTSEPETEPAIPAVTVKPVPASVPDAAIGDGSTVQAEPASPEPEPVLEESAPVMEPSAPEPSSIPVVEEATSAEEKDTTVAVPEPAIPDAPTLEETKSASAEPTPVPTENALVQAIPMFATTAQDPALDAELTHTQAVCVPAAELVLASEMPDVASPDSRAGDSPTEPATATVPIPVSERPAPEDDISTVKETVVAVSVDSEPVIVEGPPVTEPEPVTNDDAAPAIQTSPIDEDQAADSADAVETTDAFEGPGSVQGGSAIEEDNRPATIPECDDVIPEDPDDVEAATPEPATEPPHIVNDTAFPVPDAESTASQAASAPSTKPDEDHTVPAAQSAVETVPSQVTQVQDPVINELPTAEETIIISEAPASESIPAQEPATSHEDEIDAAQAESAVAEDVPVAEPVGETSTSSELPPPEVQEGPATEPVSEPRTAIAPDSSASHTNGSADPAIVHDEQVVASEPDTVVTTAGIANPVDEVSVPEVSVPKAEASIVAESQANTNDSESVLPTEEPLASVPETSTSVVEEAAPPTEAETPAEAPAPAAQEAGSTTEEAAAAAAETSALTSVPSVQEPAPEEATAPEVPKTTAEGPALSLAGSDPVPEEVAPVVTDDIVVDPVPAIEEPTPAIEPHPAHDDTPAELPASVSEGPNPLLEAAPATTEAVVLKEDEPVVPEGTLDNLAPSTEDPTPAAESPAPTTDETPAETSEQDAEGLHTPKPAAAVAVVEETTSAADEQPSGLEGTVEADEESIPAGEQVTQESAAHSSSEDTGIATQEEPPSVETTAVSEPEAPLTNSASSEITGAA